MYKQTIFLIGILVVLAGAGVLSTLSLLQRSPSQNLFSQPTPIPTPLAIYTFEHLKEISFAPVPITLGTILSETQETRSQLFSYSYHPNPGTSEAKTVTGVMHIPKKPGKYPVIVMFRGYVPQESYVEGAGTNPSARVFAQSGFITLAPDFLGFGASDSRGGDEYENRFQTYTTALTLLSSIEGLNHSLDASLSGTIQADTAKVGIWGHSNGGHIALATLAITGKVYPTVLWAPVSKPFPYSVLAYTDEEDDGGKASRRSLATFESIYDTDLFDPSHYYSFISAPIQLHQGTADEEVPYWWSDELVKKLREHGKSVEYQKYAGTDHNLRPAWNEVIDRSISFYEKSFSKTH